MAELILSILAAVRVFLRSRGDTALEVLALRQQLAVLKRKRPRTPMNSFYQLFSRPNSVARSGGEALPSLQRLAITCICRKTVLIAGGRQAGKVRGASTMGSQSPFEFLDHSGYDPDGAADFYSRLLYATTQNLNVDAGFQREFGIPNNVNAPLQELWTNVRNACVASTGLTSICQKAHKYWHPDNPANVP